MEEIHWERMFEEALERGAGYLGGTMSSHQNEYGSFSTPGGPLKAMYRPFAPPIAVQRGGRHALQASGTSDSPL